MLVPTSAPGSLESLCVAALAERYPNIADCVEAFLDCAALRRAPAERRSKAALAAMIAAVSERKPTLPLQAAFSDDPPLIDVLHPAFTPLADTLRHLLTNPPAP